ncbi:MAG: hypothetical protein ACK4IX_14865, partial [Candidatus Sericytochromatia bacterium]
FANWNLQFYKKYSFDIASLDDAETNPTQFIVTKNVIKETSEKMKRRIDLVITAVGTGAIVDSIEKELDFLEPYLNSITLTDLKDIDLSRWKLINDSSIVLKKQIGSLIDINFISELSGDMFYGNELFGDIPNRFVYKNNGKLYDIWIKAYSKTAIERLPELIEKEVKNILKSIYYKGVFPKIFTPEIGKLLSFDIAFKRRIFSKEIEYYYRNYPDDCIIAISDEAYQVLFFLYEQVKENGTVLFHDYGFFSPENLHLIENFLRKDNDNHFVRNYYGEFTTDPSFDYAYSKLKPFVMDISIKKTVDLVSQISNTPKELVSLDGFERKPDFFIDLITERFEVWKKAYDKNYLVKIIQKYIKDLKDNTANLDETINLINKEVKELSEDNILTIRKILMGYFNEDDHRFLTIRISK